MKTVLASTRNQRWMLVDDNEDIRLMLTVAAKSLTGAEIESYDSPLAALTAFTAAPESYELVITDFEMPELDGVALCRRLRAITPTQKIVLATGSGFFTEAAARHAGFCGLLNKPFPLAMLRDRLQVAGVMMEATTALA